MVANLRPVKDVERLVHAAADLAGRFPEVTFHVAGEGDERPRLERLLGELGLAARFRLEGSVRDIPAFLARLDVAVLCSRSEGMSNAVLEYMAAGRPVVATAVGATPSSRRTRMSDFGNEVCRLTTVWMAAGLRLCQKSGLLAALHHWTLRRPGWQARGLPATLAPP